MNAHTPTPWVIEHGYLWSVKADTYAVDIRTTADRLICEPADAQHIVKCVNAHDELVAALTGIAFDEKMDSDSQRLIRAIKLARAALTKVQS